MLKYTAEWADDPSNLRGRRLEKRLLGVSGASLGASGGRLEGSWGDLKAVAPQRCHKDTPKGTKKAPECPPRRAQEATIRPKRPQKHHQNNNKSENYETLKIDDPLNGIQRFLMFQTFKNDTKPSKNKPN